MKKRNGGCAKFLFVGERKTVRQNVRNRGKGGKWT